MIDYLNILKAVNIENITQEEVSETSTTGFAQGVNRSVKITLENGEKYLFKAQKEEHISSWRYIPPKEAYKREVAAYLIDKALGFNSVPETKILNFKGSVGSGQKWIDDTYHVTKKNDEFVNILTFKDLFKFGLFDILIGQTDRHGRNFLVVLKEFDKYTDFYSKKTIDFELSNISAKGILHTGLINIDDLLYLINIKLIDNGYSFPYKLGEKSVILSRFTKAIWEMEIPQIYIERIESLCNDFELKKDLEELLDKESLKLYYDRIFQLLKNKVAFVSDYKPIKRAFIKNKELIFKMNNVLNKGKIYFQPDKGEKPPEDKKVEVGSRGGKYYLSDSGVDLPFIYRGLKFRAYSKGIGLQVFNPQTKTWEDTVIQNRKALERDSKELPDIAMWRDRQVLGTLNFLDSSLEKMEEKDIYDWIDEKLELMPKLIGGKQPRGTKQLGKKVEYDLYSNLKNTVNRYLDSLSSTTTKENAIDGMIKTLEDWEKKNVNLAGKAIEALYKLGFTAGIIGTEIPAAITMVDKLAIEYMKLHPNGIIPVLKTFDDIIRDKFTKIIERHYEVPGEFSLNLFVKDMQKEVTTERWKLERIVRTSAASVSNSGRLMAWLREAEEDDTEAHRYEYFWNAAIDSRSKPISIWRWKGNPWSLEEIKFLWQNQIQKIDGKVYNDVYNNRCSLSRSPVNYEFRENRLLEHEGEFQSTSGIF